MKSVEFAHEIANYKCSVHMDMKNFIVLKIATLSPPKHFIFYATKASTTEQIQN